MESQLNHQAPLHHRFTWQQHVVGRCGIHQFQKDPEGWRRRAGSTATLRNEFAAAIGSAAPVKSQAIGRASAEDSHADTAAADSDAAGQPDQSADPGVASSAAVLQSHAAADADAAQPPKKKRKKKRDVGLQAVAVSAGVEPSDAAAQLPQHKHMQPSQHSVRSKAALNSLLTGTENVRS